MVAAGVLLFSQFPPDGSRLVEDDQHGDGSLLREENVPILEDGSPSEDV